MLISILRYLKGYLRIRITGYSPERFLNLCSHHQIYLWDLTPSSHSYEMYISVKGFRKLKPIVRKTRTKVIIVGRYGFPFFLHRYRKRKMFFAGAFVSIALIYFMSLFIWNIHIEGNCTRTDENILEFLESQNVEHGMKKSKVDCDRIVKDIRKQYDDIIWVSASIQGTRLIIQVKENEDTFTEEEDTDTKEPCDIIADKDGIISSIITRSGVPQVGEGSEVKKGDLLVSGKVEVKNDAGEVVNYQYQASDADIFAQTTLNYENEIPLTYTAKEYSGTEKHLYFLKIGKYTFSLGSLKNNDKNSERMTKETQARIGESFYLPLTYGVTRIRHYTPKEKPYSKKELQTLLTGDFERFCEDLEKKGVQILENDVKIYTGQKSALAKGSLKLIEPVGTDIPTEVTKIEPKEDTEREE